MNTKEDLLFTACMKGDMVKIQKLIKSTFFSKAVNVNAKRTDAEGNYETPLICAINSGKKEAAKLLISSGAHINALITNKRTQAKEWFYSGHNTPLIYAIKRNNREITEFLINAGAKINSGNSENSCPLICAIKSDSREIIELLISKGADVNFHFEITPLLSAVKMGDKETVQFLISKGADVNLSPGGIRPLIYALNDNLDEIAELLYVNGGKGYSPGDALGLALKYGFIKLAKLMLSNGCDMSNEGLEYAFKSDDKELFELLTNRTDNIFETSSYNESSKWAEFCCPEILRFLISRGVDINKANSNGDTPLYDAIKFGTEEIVDILISNGADLNIVGKSGLSALFVAIREKKEKLAELLVNKYCVDIIDDRFGYLALALAKGSGRLAELLLSNGYKNVDKTESDCTPLLYAVNHNFLDIVKSLVERGADINLKSPAYYTNSRISNGEDGFTPLHLASQKGYTAIVEFLLKAGANVDCLTDGHTKQVQDCDGCWWPVGIINNGLTPLYYAQINGHIEIEQLLLEYGANPKLTNSTKQ